MGVLRANVGGTWVDIGGSSGGGGGAPTGAAGGALAGTYPDPDLAAAVAGSGITKTGNVLSANGAVVQLLTGKAAVNGYASLDGTTKVPIAQVPTGTSSTTVALGNHTHSTYQVTTEKAAANGYASLDASTKLPVAQLPSGMVKVSTGTTAPASPAVGDVWVDTT